jgi:hypothetical protein
MSFQFIVGSQTTAVLHDLEKLLHLILWQVNTCHFINSISVFIALQTTAAVLDDLENKYIKSAGQEGGGGCSNAISTGGGGGHSTSSSISLEQVCVLNTLEACVRH